MLQVYVGIAGGTAICRSDRVDRFSARCIKPQVDVTERSGVSMFRCGASMPTTVLPRTRVRLGGRVIRRRDEMQSAVSPSFRTRYTVDGTVESSELPEIEQVEIFDMLWLGDSDEPNAEDLGFYTKPPIERMSKNYGLDNSWKRTARVRKQWAKPSARRRHGRQSSIAA